MTSFRTRLSHISWGLIFTTLILAVALDQLTKRMILNSFEHGEVLEIMPGFFNLTLHFNKGAAFGLFAGLDDGYRQLVLGLFSKLAIVMLLVFLVYEFYQSKLGQLCIGLILGGAFGNIIDRVYRGEVVDFLDFYIGQNHWPAFNVADSCICIGVFILILFESKSKAKKPEVVSSGSIP
jgi:signal peptidase II